MAALQIAVYALTLWMGLYMLERAGAVPGVRYAGIGFVLYTLGLGWVLLASANGTVIRWQPWVALVVIPPWTIALIYLRQMAVKLASARRRALLAYIAAVFFGLIVLLMLTPQTLLSRTDLLLALSIDLVIMGYVIAWLTARHQGEALLPDAIRSLLLTVGGCLIFGGQVALIVSTQGQPTPLTQFLLLQVITNVVLVVVFNRYLLRGLDALVYQGAPQVQSSRSALREASDAIARSDPKLDPLSLDPDEFTRLTRRALSHMNRPQKLIANPLMQLSLIDAHPSFNGDSNSTLERANILRMILAERIDKLRPPGTDTHGTTDGWRHYNALYYPYVAGIKPYSSRTDLRDLDADTRVVIEWIRSQVPERTLYNWQNAAAALIAQDLLDELHQQTS
jgi:hypothetical protein